MKSDPGTSYKALPCLTIDKEFIRLYFAVGAYFMYIVQIKDLLYINHGNLMVEPCMSCHITCSKIPFPSKELCHTNYKTSKIMNLYDSLNEVACALTLRMPGEVLNLCLKAKDLLNSKSMYKRNRDIGYI